jgi:hypothetical protein
MVRKNKHQLCEAEERRRVRQRQALEEFASRIGARVDFGDSPEGALGGAAGRHASSDDGDAGEGDHGDANWDSDCVMEDAAVPGGGCS